MNSPLPNHPVIFTVLGVASLAFSVACGSDTAPPGHLTAASGGKGGADAGPSPAAGGSPVTSSGGSPSGKGGASNAMGGSTTTPSSGGAVTAAGGGPVDADGGPDTGTTSPGSKGPCCAAHAGNGCSDPAIEKCVCGMAGGQYCCTNGWSDACVALVGGLGCGVCKGSCCSESAAPGCTDQTVQTCVCKKDTDCCNSAWDGFCVELVSSTAAGPACGKCP